MDENPIRIVTSVIVPYESRYILVKTKKDGKYGLPGGKVEPFEDFRKAAPREVKEETGLEVVLENLVQEYLLKSPKGNYVFNAVYSSKLIEGTPRIINPNEIEDIQKFSLGEIRNLNSEGDLRMATLEPVEEYLRGKALPLSTIRYLG